MFSYLLKLHTRTRELVNCNLYVMFVSGAPFIASAAPEEGRFGVVAGLAMAFSLMKEGINKEVTAPGQNRTKSKWQAPPTSIPLFPGGHNPYEPGARPQSDFFE